MAPFFCVTVEVFVFLNIQHSTPLVFRHHNLTRVVDPYPLQCRFEQCRGRVCLLSPFVGAANYETSAAYVYSRQDCNDNWPTPTAAVPCPVSEWSEWSDCDADCGTGTSTRVRYTMPPSLKTTAACASLPLIQSQSCGGGVACSANCTYGDWSAWSTCSQTCMGGTRYVGCCRRHRCSCRCRCRRCFVFFLYSRLLLSSGALTRTTKVAPFPRTPPCVLVPHAQISRHTLLSASFYDST